jgi:hypothetical protein
MARQVPFGRRARPATRAWHRCTPNMLDSQHKGSESRYAGSCAPARTLPTMPDRNLRPQSTRRHIIPRKISDAEWASEIVAPSGASIGVNGGLPRWARSTGKVSGTVDFSKPRGRATRRHDLDGFAT